MKKISLNCMYQVSWSERQMKYRQTDMVQRNQTVPSKPRLNNYTMASIRSKAFFASLDVSGSTVIS